MIKDALKITKIHLNRLDKAKKEIEQLDKLENIDLDNFEVIKIIDTFIFHFMKLQDYMGNKLFKAFLAEIGDFRDEMSLIDVLDRLEKLRIIDSTENWIKLRKLRNKLAHEYPDEQDKILEEIKEAMKWVDYFKEIYDKITGYLIKRKIIL